ncbi:MAG: PKD domain-containing protein [Elusimicrobia bacterium]|nr:PKD domain-containing protein [Candidatus Obscuribacterium magneticum]
MKGKLILIAAFLIVLAVMSARGFAEEIHMVPLTIGGMGAVGEFHNLHPSLVVVDGSRDYAPEVGADVHFFCTPSGGRYPYDYLWVFGDGQTSTDQNPIHAFEKASIYTVTVKVTDHSSPQPTSLVADPITVTVRQP